MTFDFICGNPPFQLPVKEATRKRPGVKKKFGTGKSVHQHITAKVLTQLSHDTTEVVFITPGNWRMGLRKASPHFKTATLMFDIGVAYWEKCSFDGAAGLCAVEWWHIDSKNNAIPHSLYKHRWVPHTSEPWLMDFTERMFQAWLFGEPHIAKNNRRYDHDFPRYKMDDPATEGLFRNFATPSLMKKDVYSWSVGKREMHDDLKVMKCRSSHMALYDPGTMGGTDCVMYIVKDEEEGQRLARNMSGDLAMVARTILGRDGKLDDVNILFDRMPEAFKTAETRGELCQALNITEEEVERVLKDCRAKWR